LKHYQYSILLKQSSGLWRLILSVFLAGCAAQGPPSGGPVDKTGPELLSTFPLNGATNVSPTTIVTLSFSELVEPRSAEGNLVIMPALKRLPGIKVHRKKLTINFYDPLKENTTYILSFGRNIQDYQKNTTESNVTLAFSTGDSLDLGQIAGKVFNIPKKYFAYVWAYRKTGSFPDSILGVQPDYITAVESNGNYRFTNIATGNYRLLAIASQVSRIPFVTADNLIATAPVDPVTIQRRDDFVQDIDFRLGTMYINRFRLQSASLVENRLELVFSRSLSDQLSHNAKIRLSEPGQAQIQSFWINDTDPRYAYVAFRGLIAEQEYTLLVDSLFDSFGDKISDPDNAVGFLYTEKADTIEPKIESSVPNRGAKDIRLNADVRLNFSEAVINDDPELSISLIKEDSLIVPCRYDWLDGNSLKMTPESKLSSKTAYKLVMNTSGWTDIAGNYFEDSLLTIPFITADANSYGSITGEIKARSAVSKAFVISCRAEKKEETVMVFPSESGQYEIEELLPGRYQFEIWEDLNQNGCWDPGRLMPFQTAEPYKSYPDWINVRARWETAEVNWTY
jgi:hypothetical protein